MTKLSLTLAFFLIFLKTNISQVLADQSSGLTVSPSIIRLDLETDLPQATITYQNNTSSPIDIYLSAVNFDQLEKGYRVKFLNEIESENYQYSLASWIDFENRYLHIEPNNSITAKIFIDTSKLTPGGHYASITAEITTPQSEQETINLKGILSSLVFIRTNTGQEIEQAVITSTEKENSFFWLFPQNINIGFQNSGNVDLIPYGLIEIKSPANKLTAKGIINSGSLITLPESTRHYTVPTNSLQKIIFPGIYSIQTSINFGKEKQVLTNSTFFFTIGNKNFITLALATILLSIIFIFINKKINRK